MPIAAVIHIIKRARFRQYFNMICLAQRAAIAGAFGGRRNFHQSTTQLFSLYSVGQRQLPRSTL